MSCHIFRSISDAYNKNTVIPFSTDVLCQSEFRDSAKRCAWDGLCGHWHILRLMTTHTWCKLRHCSSVAVTALSGVKSEPTVACLANPPFRAISTFSSPKWGPPRAMNHRVYLCSCPLTLNQYDYPVGSTLHFLKVVERNIDSHGKYWEVYIESRYVYQSCFTDMSFSSLRLG